MGPVSHDGTYYLVVDGVQLPLTRVDTIRLVTLIGDQDPTTVASRLANFPGVVVDRNYPPQFLVVRGELQDLEQLRSDPGIENTRAAFQDPDGNLLILTNDILVSFKDGTGDNEREAVLAQYPGEVIERSERFWTFRVSDPGEDAPLLLAQQLSNESIVKYAEPNALQAVTLDMLPQNEPLFGNQWHLQNTGQGGGTPGADVDALGAWETTSGVSTVRVVIHDHGVDINHPDLVANIGPGWDFDDGDSDTTNLTPPPKGPHGTACAGVVAAAVNNQGVTGIAPDCQIIPLKAADGHLWSTWADTFDWAAEHGEIISCSWHITPNNTLSDAIRRAVKNGVAVFCASGNSGASSMAYPASMPETIAVGASTNADVRASYSQFGLGLDFVAPSNGGTRNIETTDVRGTNGFNTAGSPAGDYCKADGGSGFGGTSAATALAAGVAALLLSVEPTLTPGNIRGILQETADKIDPVIASYDPTGWSSRYGYGRINARKAVRRARPYAPVYNTGSPGGGIGGYDLAHPADQIFAFDFDHSGRLDHLVLYRSGTGTIWILHNSGGGSFTMEYPKVAPGSGIGGYDLADPADQVFAFDYEHTGRLDHLVLYRPGTGTIWILHNSGGTFSSVYPTPAVAPGSGIGGYDLADPADRVFAFDYDGRGRLDYLALYRPGTGTIWILRNNDGTFTKVYPTPTVTPGSGIGGYDLAHPADRVLAFDYAHTGRLDHLVLYRPGRGTIWILRNSGGTFSPRFVTGDPGAGIGGYDLADPADRVFAFDYEGSGRLDYLALYRPGSGTIWILGNSAGTYKPDYATGAPGSGIGGYDLAHPADRVLAFDYEHTGRLDHLVLYRPGTGTIWILRK
jgi:subtilisin family serine protease